MVYVDGFVMVVPKKNIKAYKKMATDAGKAWIKRGALQYMETVGEDLRPRMEGMPENPMNFIKLTNLKKEELVVFSFIVFKNRKHRDSVNKKVMADFAKIYAGHENDPMPFDTSKVSVAGFESIVNLKK